MNYDFRKLDKDEIKVGLTVKEILAIRDGLNELADVENYSGVCEEDNDKPRQALVKYRRALFAKGLGKDFDDLLLDKLDGEN